MLINKTKLEIIKYCSAKGLDYSSRPYQEMAKDLKLSEEEIVGLIQEMQREGIIKSLRGVFNHQSLGYQVNALVAWQIPEEQMEMAQEKLTKTNMVSHCYHREPHKDFNYNMFTMLHAQAKEQIEQFIADITHDVPVPYEILYTEKELKKERLDLGKIIN